METIFIINLVGFLLLTLILILAAIGAIFGWWWSSSFPNNNMEDLATFYGYSSNKDIPGSTND